MFIFLKNALVSSLQEIWKLSWKDYRHEIYIFSSLFYGLGRHIFGKMLVLMKHLKKMVVYFIIGAPLFYLYQFKQQAYTPMPIFSCNVEIPNYL